MINKVIDLDFPKVMSFEVPKDVKGVPFAGVTTEIVQRVHESSYRGIVSKEGVWIVNPGFTLEKKDIGKYKIIHNIGYNSSSLSLSSLEPIGVVRALEHHPQWFVVETLIDNVPADKAFSFTLTMVISPPLSVRP